MLNPEHRHPCPHCGRLFTKLVKAERGVSEGSVVRVHDIEDHECSSWRTEEPLPPTDPAFRVIRDRTEEEAAESMRRYRRMLR